MTDNSINRWVAFPRRRPHAKLRLFCIPYAGGSSTIFHGWTRRMPDSVEICLVHLPGRGGRLSEPSFTQLIPLAHAIGENLSEMLDKPFAFFGHSMGALVSFEVARYLRRHARILPAALFVSGRRAPQLPDTDPRTHDLPLDEFLEEIRRINGTPQEVLDNSELVSMLVPVIRADFEACQTYEYSPEPPLDCPIIAFGGADDLEETRDKIDAWREQTTRFFALTMLQGDHFFLHKSEAALLGLLGERLGHLIRALP